MAHQAGFQSWETVTGQRGLKGTTLSEKLFSRKISSHDFSDAKSPTVCTQEKEMQEQHFSTGIQHSVLGEPGQNMFTATSGPILMKFLVEESFGQNVLHSILTDNFYQPLAITGTRIYAAGPVFRLTRIVPKPNTIPHSDASLIHGYVHDPGFGDDGRCVRKTPACFS